MITRTIVVIATLLSISGMCIAQTVVRPDDATLRLRYKADISIADAKFRLIVGNRDVNVRASSEDRDIVITLSQDDIALVRQRTTSNGASFLLISGLTLGKKPATDSVMLIPDTLTVQAVSTAIEMKILLRPNYIPNELKDSVLKGDFWRVGTDDTQYKVDHVKPDLDDPTDPRLTLFLDTQPRNAAKLSVTIPDPTDRKSTRLN